MIKVWDGVMEKEYTNDPFDPTTWDDSMFESMIRIRLMDQEEITEVENVNFNRQERECHISVFEGSNHRYDTLPVSW